MYFLTISQNTRYAHVERGFRKKAVTRAAPTHVINPASDYARFANGCAAPSTERKNALIVADSAAHTSMLSSAASISTCAVRRIGAVILMLSNWVWEIMVLFLCCVAQWTTDSLSY